MFFASSAEIRAVYRMPRHDRELRAHCYIEPDRSRAGDRAALARQKPVGTDERPLLGPADLAGPEFAGKIIALVPGHRPPGCVRAPQAGQRRAR